MSSEVACRAVASCEGRRYPSSFPQGYATGSLDSTRDDNHMDSIAPKHGAHRCAIGNRYFQRQCREIVNAGSHVAEIKSFNDGDSGPGKRVVILQRFGIEL